MSLFSKAFYKLKERSGLRFKKTAVPTGLLSTHLRDLLSSQPWLTTEEVEDLKKSDEKRILIFADHAYQHRFNKKETEKQLRQALIYGFQVFILESSGKLEPWDGRPLSKSHALNLPWLLKEEVQQLALKQYQLGSNDSFILDHDSFHQLFNHTSHHYSPQMLEELFALNTKQARAWLSSLKEIRLSLNNLESDFDFSCLKGKITTITHKSDNGTFSQRFASLLQTSTELRALELTLNLNDDAPPCKNPEKKQIFFLPSLQKLTLTNHYYNGFLMRLSPSIAIQAPQLKELTLSTAFFAEDQIPVFPALRKLNVDGSCFGIDATSLIRLFQQTPLLTQVTLGWINSEMSSALFKTSQQLEIFECSDTSNINQVFENLKPKQLQYLKKIKLPKSSMPIQISTINILIEAAPHLEEMDNFPFAQDPLLLSSLITKLPRLKKINGLKVIRSSSGLNTVEEKQKVDSFTFSSKNLSLIINTLNTCLNQNIKIKTLTLEGNSTEEIRFALSNLNNAQLKNVENIYLPDAMQYEIAELQALLNKAPHLNIIYNEYYDSSKEDLTSQASSETQAASAAHYKKRALNPSMPTQIHSFTRYFPGVKPDFYRYYPWQPSPDNFWQGSDKKPADDFENISFIPKNYTHHPQFICYPGIRPRFP